MISSLLKVSECAHVIPKRRSPHSAISLSTILLADLVMNAFVGNVQCGVVTAFCYALVADLVLICSHVICYSLKKTCLTLTS
jgi:hypothetical protein